MGSLCMLYITLWLEQMETGIMKSIVWQNNLGYILGYAIIHQKNNLIDLFEFSDTPQE